MMATTARSIMARVAIFVALLAQLQPALATFWTVTEYYMLSETSSKYSACTTSCRYYTYTATRTVQPTVTPTASPVSTRTYSDIYDDVEVISLFLPAGAVAESDLVPITSTYTENRGPLWTDYAVPVTYTAPSSCPTPFTVETITEIHLPNEVTAHVAPISTATSLYTNTRSNIVVTYVTYILDRTAVPSTLAGNPTTAFAYTYYVQNCRNPTATGAAFRGPGYTSGSGGSRSGDWDDWNVCYAWSGCVGLKTWVIVVATVIPTIFLLGFVESYCWFRRMMLGKSALRLGTICWCCMSLWFILLTRKSAARSPQDQALLKQYWATLSAGQRIKYWFKWGFRWRYPVELLGNPDGSNPAVVIQQQGAPMPPGPPGQGPVNGAAGGDGTEKAQAVVAQQQPVYMPYPGQPVYVQPGQQLPPGFVPAPQGGFMMPVPPQAAYVAPQQGQPGFVPAPPPAGDGQQQQQQQYSPYVPSPSPVHSGTTEVLSMQPTPPPGHEHHHQPPPYGGQQQSR
ncbi:hypothetical protein VTI74DRAFT_5793 [Chaetomium olivicolor]